MFARLEAWFNAFFLGYAARVSGDLAVGLVPVALALVTLYVAVYGLAVMRGEATEPVGTFAWKMVKVGAILSFALPGLYYSGNVAAAATGLQDGLATLFVAPRGVAAATAFGALDLANTAANEQLALLWKDAGMFRLDLVLASLLFSLGTTIFLVLGAFVALLGKLILTFALAIGPLAILCLLFKPTARFFDSWLSFVLSAVILSWFVFFALGMSLYVSDRVVAAIADGSAFVAGRARVGGCARSGRHLLGCYVPPGHRALPSAIACIQPDRWCLHPKRRADGHQLDGGDARHGRRPLSQRWGGGRRRRREHGTWRRSCLCRRSSRGIGGRRGRRRGARGVSTRRPARRGFDLKFQPLFNRFIHTGEYRP